MVFANRCDRRKQVYGSLLSMNIPIRKTMNKKTMT